MEKCKMCSLQDCKPCYECNSCMAGDDHFKPMQKVKTMDELKPCPFCGGKVNHIHTDHKNLKSRSHFFTCHSCGAEFFLPATGKYQSVEDTEVEAVAIFNRRPRPENKPLTLEQLKQMDGEPYWHKSLLTYERDGWKILNPFIAKHPEEYHYGENWLAYAHKPEGSET